ncbi:phosphotransferase enzyme family protein [Frankia sp. AgB32]|uniref:phosphotransferase enzyme family protein n=1 Tax=Frankia sp. AgB32 TaxID=631119 RepID=UPI00200C58ED|nr:aminoglycoside phosphotransferase family protein [Frankia sp. AgB32]MCK9897504.1 aminoglycoside phosphotransferase family protein [Frankia sp. AgB32]
MAAYDVLARLGVDPPDLELLRFGENALYAFPPRRLVLRVARPGTSAEHVARTIEFVRRVAAQGMEVPEPTTVAGIDQPVVTSTGVVSLWALYDIDRDCRVSAAELGGLLRHFHDLAARESALVDEWDPFDLIRPRLAAARRDGIARELTDPLESLRTRLESAVPAVRSVLGNGVIHCDMHYGNVMCLPGHRLLLIDYDQVALGPREWDLVPNLVTYRRFGMSDADYGAFCGAYGYDLRSSPHVDTFVALRELGMVTWLLQQYGTSAAIDAEIELRVRTIAEPGTRATTWSAR